MTSKTMVTEDLYAKLYKDRTYADVTFVADGKEEKAHKCVLAHRCGYLKNSFRENKANVINVDGMFLKFLKEVVKFCYLEKIDVTDWSYYDKEFLHKVATSYSYGPLMDLVQRELDKRPEVPLSVETLNEWYDNCPAEELREWIENNRLNILNYEDCHKYTEDLMLFIVPIFYKMSLDESNKLLTVQKQLFKWLLRWRNWCNRTEEDVSRVFSKFKIHFMLNERPAWERSLAMKLSQVVRDFMWLREVKTAGWKRDEVLELMCFAHVYDIGQLFDTVLNIVTTQHLEPSSFATLYGLARKLESSKLEQVLIDYLRNNTKSIITSAAFTKYPSSAVEFVFANLSGQVMDVETKRLIYISMTKWRQLNSEKDVQDVFKYFKWQDFFRKLGADLFIKSFNDDHSEDVTFVLGKLEIKAHKSVLANSCNSFKKLFDLSKGNRIKIKGTHVEELNRAIKDCYKRMIDFTHWDLSERKHVYDWATKYNYQPLMDMIKLELDKRQKVPFSVESLNELYGKCPDEDIREWVKNNQLTIVNYEDCHKYNQDLVVLIMDTFCELADKETDKEKLETPLKKLLRWLFRWRNSAIRREEDVQSVFARIRLPLVFKDRALGNKSLQVKLFGAVRRFCHTGEVDTAGWNFEDELELLNFTRDYEFGPLLGALVNVLGTKHLNPASLETIYGVAGKLESRKLQNLVREYLRNQAMTTRSSAEFNRHPDRLVGLEKLNGQAMDKKVAKEGAFGPAEVRKSKRKLGDNSQRRRSVRLRKE